MGFERDTGLAADCAQVQSTCGCEGIRRTARTVTQHYEGALAPAGVRATQFPILVALGSVGTVPLTRLADALAIDRTTLTRNLKKLEERSLVDILPAADGRLHLVALTEVGGRVLRESLSRWSEVQASVEERFGKDRLQHLLGELSALMEIVRS